MGKRSFLMYDNWKSFFESLSNDDAGELIKAIYTYRETGRKETDNPQIKALLAFMISTLDTDEEKYQERCRRNAENVRNRWKN